MSRQQRRLANYVELKDDDDDDDEEGRWTCDADQYKWSTKAVSRLHVVASVRRTAYGGTTSLVTSSSASDWSTGSASCRCCHRRVPLRCRCAAAQDSVTAS